MRPAKTGGRGDVTDKNKGKARPGRRQSAKRQRTKQCLVRFTEAEFADVAAKADRAGVALAAYLRAAALGHPGLRAQRRPPADHEALRRILGQLGRIGNNINQIARALNNDKSVPAAEIRAALRVYPDVRAAIFAALGKDASEPPAGSPP
jgi:hypothetical protein